MEMILPEEISRDYYINLKTFVNGSIEALVKVVKPMKQEMMQAEACYSPGMLPLRHRSADLTEEEQEAKLKENWLRSVRRAKQNVRWLCKQMEADRLFTLTYRENVQDREKVKADFTRFLRLVRNGGFRYVNRKGQLVKWHGDKNWRYVAVLERQDRGALHIHCAVQGWQRIEMLRAAWYCALGAAHDAAGADTPGQVNVTSPRADDGQKKRQWKTSRLASYISKYMEKTFEDALAEKKRYWRSKDLQAPVKTRVWLCATNMEEAIKESWAYCQKVYAACCGQGLGGLFTWINDDNTAFWLAADGDAVIATGCPF